jgi:ABC-2 type transport system permease protein
MLNNILTIARTHLYMVFQDRGALALMFIAPIAISTIIGLAFASNTDEFEIADSRVLVVNQDQTLTLGAGPTAREVNYGQQVYGEVFVENTPEGLQDYIEGEYAEDVEASRALVEEGEARAVLIIPPDFSAQVTAGQGRVTLYYNPGDPISATLLVAVVEEITANLNRGQVGEAVLFGNPDGYIVQKALSTGQFDAIIPAATALMPKLYAGDFAGGVQLQTVNVEGEAQTFDSLQYFAPAMAIMFMTFAMAGGARNILEEQTNGTMARIFTTPTPRWAFLAGKMLGTFVTGLIQMAFLLLAMPLVATLLGRESAVWGTNYIGVLAVTVAVVMAGTGLGLFIAALSQTPRQADNYGSAALTVLAMLGGSFTPVENIPVLNALSKLTLNNWGITAFNDLAANSAGLADVALNLAVLTAMGGVFFILALLRLNQRLTI